MRPNLRLGVFGLTFVLFFSALIFAPRTTATKSSRAGKTAETNGEQTLPAGRQGRETLDVDDPDRLGGEIGEAEDVRLREEQIARMRGYEPGKPFDPAPYRERLPHAESNQRYAPRKRGVRTPEGGPRHLALRGSRRRLSPNGPVTLHRAGLVKPDGHLWANASSRTHNIEGNQKKDKRVLDTDGSAGVKKRQS